MPFRRFLFDYLVKTNKFLVIKGPASFQAPGRSRDVPNLGLDFVLQISVGYFSSSLVLAAPVRPPWYTSCFKWLINKDVKMIRFVLIHRPARCVCIGSAAINPCAFGIKSRFIKSCVPNASGKESSPKPPQNTDESSINDRRDTEELWHSLEHRASGRAAA